MAVKILTVLKMGLRFWFKNSILIRILLFIPRTVKWIFTYRKVKKTWKNEGKKAALCSLLPTRKSSKETKASSSSKVPAGVQSAYKTYAVSKQAWGILKPLNFLFKLLR